MSFVVASRDLAKKLFNVDIPPYTHYGVQETDIYVNGGYRLYLDDLVDKPLYLDDLVDKPLYLDDLVDKPIYGNKPMKRKVSIARLPLNFWKEISGKYNANRISKNINC